MSAFSSVTAKSVAEHGKTHITHANDGLVFLGHRIIRKRSSRGHMRPVTGIPRASINKLAHRLTQLLSSQYDLNAVTMIRRINRIINGWTAFYRNTHYTLRVYNRLDTIVFWKFGHWLARKYRTRVNKLMRKWYRFSTAQGVRTWVLHSSVNGRCLSASLMKFARAYKGYYVTPCCQVNPFLVDKISAGGSHYSYTHIASLTET